MVTPPRQKTETIGEVVDVVTGDHTRRHLYTGQAKHSGQGSEQASGGDQRSRGPGSRTEEVETADGHELEQVSW